MKFNPLTASERRGIIVLAIVALLITGAGVGMSFLHKGKTIETVPEISVLVEGDSLDNGSSSKKNRKTTKKNKKTKEKKVYRRRSPLDEPV